MTWVGKDTESETALGEAVTVLGHCGFKPLAGHDIVVLMQDLACAGKTGWAGGQIGAEEQEVARGHRPTEPAKQGEGIEVGQNAEKRD